LTNSRSFYSEILSRPFNLIDDLGNRLFLILFCGVFGSLFIIIFNPFNIEGIQYDGAIGKALPIWTAGLIGSMVLIVTQLPFRYFFRVRKFSVATFSIWIISEFLLITTTVYFIFGELNNPFIKEYSLIMRYTLSLAVLPYFMACLLIATFRKPEYPISSLNPSLPDEQLLLKEDNGKFIMALNRNNILYLKSENNYTDIAYLENGETRNKLLRNKLKNLEQDLKGTKIIRVHRSFMVNIQKIESISRSRNGFEIVLTDLPDLKIKVSESYKKSFIRMVNPEAV